MLNKQSLAMVGRIVVLASFTLLGGCKHQTHVVRLILHGSVVIGVTAEKTTILSPAEPSHALVAGYPNLEEATSTPCGAGAYEFTLKGVKPAEKKAGANGGDGSSIDPAFDAITFTRPNWQPPKQAYFVRMVLPAAARIVALGPRYQIQFQGSSGPSFVPLTQMLEFEARDGDDVRLVRKCGQDEKQYKPLSCTEMRARYDKVFAQVPPDAHALKPSEREYIDFAFKSCADDASYLFVGVGIDPRHGSSSEDHGVDFFNTKILPAIFENDKVPEDKKLVKHGRIMPNGGSGSDNGEVRLIRTSFDGEQPRYVPVLMIENCTSPGGFVHP